MPEQTYREAHANFVESYIVESSAITHAERIGGSIVYVWCSGIDTWQVWRGTGYLHADSSLQQARERREV